MNNRKRKTRTTAVKPALKLAADWIREICHGRTGRVRVDCRRQDWGPFQTGRSVVDKPLCVAGKTYAGGFGTHADSEIVLRSGMPMTRFRAVVGVDDNENTRGLSPAKLVFSVRASGREAWKSPLLGWGEKAEVDLAIPEGSGELILRATAPDGNRYRAHADWAGVAVTIGARTVRFPATPGAVKPPLPAPFSFVYNGRLSLDLLPGWQRRTERVGGPRGETIHRVTWSDPDTGLECRMDVSEFPGHAALEWVVYFRNGGASDTPILENIQALDMDWPVQGETALFRSRGSPCAIHDFEYLCEPIASNVPFPRNYATNLKMVAGGGRSSQEWLPFFNLQSGDSGVISAIGWTGQWAAEFVSQGGSVSMRAGMERTHLKLHPGEQIRSPRMLLLFWDKDRLAGHNALRRFILDYHTPRPAGGFKPPLTTAHWGGMKMPGHLARIEAYRRAGLDYDHYWVDAGWYGPADSYSPDEHKGDWGKHVGNWSVNPVAHPAGLRPIADAANAAGMKFLLWFEPERAICGTPWTIEHPEWFLGDPKPLKNVLFDLGNPEARQWLTRFLLDFMDKNRVDCYRQDFNFEPLPYWRGNDEPDRQGISEIRHIEGLYAFWDALLEGRPGLIIDNCASGGRRIDLETIGRSIPLWRSDWQCFPKNDPVGGQVHGMGLSYWVPLHGTGTWGAMTDDGGRLDTYRVRSIFSAALQISAAPYEYTPLRKSYPWAWHRRMMRDARRAQPLFAGDYYPLTGCTPGTDQWAAYQMHRRDLDDGMVMALRRQDSPFGEAAFRLQGLKPKAVYEVEDADTGRKIRMPGRTLMEEGIRVAMKSAPQSRLLFYRGRG